MIELLRPWALLALPLPLLAWWLLPAAAPAARMQVTESVLVLMRLMHGGGGHRIRAALPLALLTAGWVALVAALAGPVTSLGNLIRPSGHDIIIAVDLSASMGRRTGNGKSTAFESYRKAVETFLGQLPSGDRVGLIAFGEQAYLIAPLTHDAPALSGYLEELTVGMPGRKTSVGVAVGLALKVFEPGAEGRRTLLVLSDGEDNAGALPAPDAALLARERGVAIHAVGIADAESGGGSRVLRQVAEITGGTFSILRPGQPLSFAAHLGPDEISRETALPLRRLWASELALLAAMIFVSLAFVRARAR